MPLKRDINSNPIQVMEIGVATDVANSTYECKDEVLRITAISDSRVWYRYPAAEKSGSGLFLPMYSQIDVAVENAMVVEVTGSVNITKFI